MTAALERVDEEPGWPDGAEPVSELTPLKVKAIRETAIAEARERSYAAELAQEMVKQRARREAKRLLDAEEFAGTAASVPPPTRLTDLLEEEDEDVEWRVESVWPRGGNVLLAAGAKAGKTTTTGNLVRSLLDGDRLFRVYPTQPVTDGTVAILDFEMPRRSVKRWLRDQSIHNREALLVWTERGMAARFDVREVELRTQWANRLREAQVKVWVIDCLSPILSALGIDENNNTEVGRVLDGVTATAVRGGVDEVVLVHHMGHVAERSRGASRLIGWADVNWKIVRKRDDDNQAGDGDPDAPRFFSAYGRDVDVREGRLLFDPDTRHLTYVEGGRKSAEHAAAMSRLLVWVRDNPDSSTEAVIKALTEKGVGRNDARKALDEAKTKAYVLAGETKGRAMRFQITAGGRSALRALSSETDAEVEEAARDGLVEERYCVCGGWIEPYDITVGYEICRPCRIEQEAA